MPLQDDACKHRQPLVSTGTSVRPRILRFILERKKKKKIKYFISNMFVTSERGCRLGIPTSFYNRCVSRYFTVNTDNYNTCHTWRVYYILTSLRPEADLIRSQRTEFGLTVQIRTRYDLFGFTCWVVFRKNADGPREASETSLYYNFFFFFVGVYQNENITV